MSKYFFFFYNKFPQRKKIDKFFKIYSKLIHSFAYSPSSRYLTFLITQKSDPNLIVMIIIWTRTIFMTIKKLNLENSTLKI